MLLLSVGTVLVPFDDVYSVTNNIPLYDFIILLKLSRLFLELLFLKMVVFIFLTCLSQQTVGVPSGPEHNYCLD